MLLHCGLLLLFSSCVSTYGHDNGLEKNTRYDETFSFWPSVHNAAQIIQLRKRAAQVQGQVPVGQSEGNAHVEPAAVTAPAPAPESLPAAGKPAEVPSAPSSVSVAVPAAVAAVPKVSTSAPTSVPVNVKDDKNNDKPEPTKAPPKDTETTTSTIAPTANQPQMDVNKPGVMMRGLIVFGGFLLLAVAYFIFYRKKSGKSDASHLHNLNDTNQFRYGVLQSDDRRDNLELSRIPLTMESDDDEDDDLEIFDLEQKKKSLSYVNLQTNDEDVVFDNSTDSRDKDNLLLDIEDGTSDTLINWTNSGNKSIL